MAVYKIFAEKDTTLYSDYNDVNTGMDAIIELSKNQSLFYPNQSTAARILIKFPQNEIQDVINRYIINKPFKAILKLYLANSTALPTDYTIEAYPVSGTWDMGTGQYGDSPITSNGATWKYRSSGKTNSWQTSSFAANVTASYNGLNFGGGVWHTNYRATQSFGVYTDKDVTLDITNIVNAHISASIPNEGLILKTSGSLEFDEAYNYLLSYFSRDTNTVFPPVLELSWDDSSYSIVSSSATPVATQDIDVSISNNKEVYNENEIYRFRLNVRDRFPVRTFSTSSLYNIPKYLPTSSYYAIKDVKADINVVDFDKSYTKISTDTKGNYFDVHMYGLQPQRYYKILIKTEISGSTIIFDDRYFFKVI
jgi:hypothetical protein